MAEAAPPPGWGHWPAPSGSARLLSLGEDAVLELRAAVFGKPVAAESRPFTNSLREIPSRPEGTPLVTAIVLNLNGAALLERLFASIARAEPYPALDFIVVDHGSTDDSVRVIEAWQRKLAILLVRCAENHSFSYSCNRAAELARGDYLLLLNNDIEFSGDVVGRLVAAAQHGVGIAGIKLFVGGTKRLHHIGVRFKWFPRRHFLGPYNSVAQPGDEKIANAPTAFPSVTAAMLLCRRDHYLEAGGQHEGYAYGYEDIDLCLKFRLGAGRGVVSLNNVSAAHWDGKTRFTQIPAAKHQAWQRYNAELFDRRCNYATRRESALALYADDGGYWGRRACVGILATSNATWAQAKPLADALAAELGWNVKRLRRGFGGVDLRGIDFLVAAEAARGGAWRHRHPAMIAASWRGADGGVPFDLALPAEIDAPGLLRRLTHHFNDCHRIAIKWSPGFDRGVAEEIARLLRDAGHPTRIDPPALWLSQDTIRDDLVILTPGETMPAPQRAKINIALAGWRGDGAVDMTVAETASPALVAAILATAGRVHAELIKGPRDAPLNRREWPKEAILAGWDSHPDPVRNLVANG